MSDMAGVNEVFAVYGKYPQDNGSVRRQLLGRFMITNNEVSILEDNVGMLGSMLIPGPLMGHNSRALRSLEESAYTEVLDEAKVKQGHYMDLHNAESGTGESPVTNAPPPILEDTAEASNRPETIDLGNSGSNFKLQAPEPVFDYFRVGMTEAQIMEVVDKRVYLNGHLLSPQEVDRVAYNVRNGLASLRYRKKA